MLCGRIGGLSAFVTRTQGTLEVLQTNVVKLQEQTAIMDGEVHQKLQHLATTIDEYVAVVGNGVADLKHILEEPDAPEPPSASNTLSTINALEAGLDCLNAATSALMYCINRTEYNQSAAATNFLIAASRFRLTTTLMEELVTDVLTWACSVNLTAEVSA